MNTSIDKCQVERQFSRAASTYDRAAGIQQQMSDGLIALLEEQINSAPNAILDLGCGTGYSLEQLSRSFPGAQLLGLDISRTMLDCARERLPGANFQQDDMESFRCNQQFNLVFSNASIQWCNLDAVLQTAHRALAPDGLLAYTSFGPATHVEIDRAWHEAAPGNPRRIDFLDPEQHLRALNHTGFQLLAQQRKLISPRFDSARALLSSIKATGATNAAARRAKGLLSRSAYARFLQNLECQKPLQLSYEILSFVARRKPER